MAENKSLHAANKAKQDEFYTQLPDIEKELKHYRKHFHGKTVYCNCDDPTISNFFRYFKLNFEKLGLKKLITTCYKNRQTEMFSKHDIEAAAGLEYVGNGTEPTVFQLKEDGNFRSRECIELLKQADIVVTNPPFSLFREYIAQLVEYDKKFVVIGNKTRYLTNVNGSPIRQEYLETAIKWISEDSIEDYMGKHQHDEDASPLWEYFQSVIDWVESTFTTTRPKMMRA